MSDLVVVVPSRDRPAAAHELRDAFDATCSLDTKLLFVIDKRDVDGIYDYPFDDRATTCWADSTSMVEALNMGLGHLFNGVLGACLNSSPFAIGFMGDDHRPRTVGWDAAYRDALRDLGTGIVYGDDLLQREKLPTQVAMTADIVRALGYMAPPSLIHLYVDNFWLSLGRSADCIRYLPDVVVEHLHPVARKAKWDAGYQRVNSSAMFDADETAFRRYAAEQFDADVAKVQALRTGARIS